MKRRTLVDFDCLYNQTTNLEIESKSDDEILSFCRSLGRIQQYWNSGREREYIEGTNHWREEFSVLYYDTESLDVVAAIANEVNRV